MALFGRGTTHCSAAEACSLEKAYPHRLFTDNGYTLIFFSLTPSVNSITSRYQTRSQLHNMATVHLHQGHLGIDRQASRFLQLQLGTQTIPVTPMHVGTREGKTSNTEATERDVHDTMFRMFQLLRGPNRSAIR